MVNYQNGKIYKIICDETGFTYYGSTTQSLSRRKAEHNKKDNKCKTKEMTIPKIYLVEDYPCERKEQLLMRERYYIENNECINKQIPRRTVNEKLEYCKNRYYEKKEEIRNYQNIYQNLNKEKLKAKQKIYQNLNKESIKEKRKEYYKNKITCECGSIIRKDSKIKHLKSKKHQKFIS